MYKLLSFKSQVTLSKSMDVAKLKFYQAGAHFVINSIKELPGLIEEINDVLQQDIYPHEYLHRKRLKHGKLL